MQDQKDLSQTSQDSQLKEDLKTEVSDLVKWSETALLPMVRQICFLKD